MIDRLATAGARPRDRASLLRELEATASFRSALRQYLNKTEAAAAAAGLTPRRYDLLLMIEAANQARAPASVSMLCRRLALKQSTVSELVKGAENAGLVRRARSESDGRVTQLELTDDGTERLLRVFEALRDDRAAFAETFGVLGSPG
jgi:DNA-binding MarR family transcriptional regulator